MNSEHSSYTIHGTNHGVIAQGEQAIGTQVNHGAADYQLARVEELLRELAARVGELGGPAADDALDDLERAQDELRRRKPDGGRMIELVNRVSAVVAPVSGLVELADHIRELIGLAVR
jgi:ABC-type transporter Mla subunit MlaD